jgi:hypothetical protein
MEIVRACTIGLSVTFLIWVAAIGITSSRLVWANWSLFRTWRKQPRKTQVNMALWLSLPGLKIWMAWMRGVLLWALITKPAVVYITPFAVLQSVIVLPVAMAFLALMLWYVCDRAHGAEVGDRMWRRVIAGGLCIGAGSTCLSLLLL